MADGRKRCPLCGIDYREVDGEQCCLVAFLRGKRRITGYDRRRVYLIEQARDVGKWLRKNINVELIERRMEWKEKSYSGYATDLKCFTLGNCKTDKIKHEKN